MIPVWDARGRAGAAIAELPLSVRPADGPAGAVAVAATPREGLEALAAGAIGLVLAAADAADPDLLAELAAASGARPVVVVRPRLREAPVTPAAVVVADCSAPPADMEAVLRDTIGWVRELTGVAPELRSATSDEAGVLALLDAGGVPVTLIARPLSGVPDGGVIRVAAVGAERYEVDVDEPAGILRVVVRREDAAVESPPRWESADRVALRRMTEALTGGETPDDLEMLVADTRTARSLRTPSG